MEKIVYSPAKVNLFLKVTGIRDDGYHELNSVFQKISLYDILTFRVNRNGGVRLECYNADIPADENNLVIKAAVKLKQYASVKAGADMLLEKHIPVGAGLGGGSSNAAMTLLTLNKLWDTRLSEDQLSDIALTIGADVPFFLSHNCAWVEGIGEKLTALTPQKPLSMLIINPGFSISSATAYRESDFDCDRLVDRRSITAAVESGDSARVAKVMRNDFEPWALTKYPELLDLKQKIESTDPRPLTVSMTGSGPTLMAVYRTDERLAKAGENIAGIAAFTIQAMTI